MRRAAPVGYRRPFAGGFAEMAVRQLPGQAGGVPRRGEGTSPRAAGGALFCEGRTPRRGGRRPGSPVEPAGRLPAVSAAEVDRLRKDLKATQAQAATAGVLEYEIGELRKALQGAERHKETIRSLNGEIVRLVAELRRLRDQKEVVKSLSGETYRLRVALEVTEARKEKLTARLAKLRAVGATLSKLPFDRAAQMRTALRRSRRQKTTIKTLSRENARLRKRAKASRNRIETLEAQLARLRATGGRAVEGAVRPQEREAGDPALRAPARPAARRPRPRTHPAARSR